MLERIHSENGLDILARSDNAILYKHSPICWTSSRAFVQVKKLVDNRPEIPVYFLDVIEHRQLARDAAELFGVPHQSPQLILLRNGHAEWALSHYQITWKAVRAKLDGE